MKRLLSYLRRAAEDYNMIDEGDKIAVGVSGGKDSVALITALNALKRFYPKRFELVGITLDMGFDNFNPEPLENFFEKEHIEYHIIKTDIKEIVFDIRKESNPCALCSKMRRGALNEAALKLGCGKIALGHHNDDVVQTFFLCLLYEGRIGCFSPVTHLDRTGITQIRPLIYAPEKEIKRAVGRLELPIVKNPCPADKNTKRQEIKELIYNLDKSNRGVRERVFGALVRSNIDGWGIKNNDA